jgi:hypothetical protein
MKLQKTKTKTKIKMKMKKDDVQMQNEIVNQIEFNYVLRESNDEVKLEIDDDDDSEMNKE